MFLHLKFLNLNLYLFVNINNEDYKILKRTPGVHPHIHYNELLEISIKFSCQHFIAYQTAVICSLFLFTI